MVPGDMAAVGLLEQESLLSAHWTTRRAPFIIAAPGLERYLWPFTFKNPAGLGHAGIDAGARCALAALIHKSTPV